MKLLLASQSPRRQELLTSAGISFTVHASDIDETPRKNERPKALVRRLAKEKALAARREGARTGRTHVLASDTTVAKGALILNKPKDSKDAARMLRVLSGSAHEVHTGVSVLDIKHGTQQTFVVTTHVGFRALSSKDIARYIATEEWLDKAGAYAVQGIGSALVAWLRGSYTSVIGLPVTETLAALNLHA